MISSVNYLVWLRKAKCEGDILKQLIKQWLLQILSVICRNDGAKVIYYHDVGASYTKMGTPLALFKSHIESVHKNGFTFVSKLQELTGPKQLLLCFDDGFRGVWDAREYFFKENLKPTIFIAVDLVGQSGFLTWDEIAELQRHGFQFESHTWRHRSLTECQDSEFEHELLDSRKYISEKLNHEVTSLCFPRGLFSSHILAACAAAGYDNLFTCIPGVVRDFHLPCDVRGMNLVPRNLVQSASSAEFKSVIQGGASVFKAHYFRRHFKTC